MLEFQSCSDQVPFAASRGIEHSTSMPQPPGSMRVIIFMFGFDLLSKPIPDCGDSFK
jgi:hypothetical protein